MARVHGSIDSRGESLEGPMQNNHDAKPGKTRLQRSDSRWPDKSRKNSRGSTWTRWRRCLVQNLQTTSNVKLRQCRHRR